MSLHIYKGFLSLRSGLRKNQGCSRVECRCVGRPGTAGFDEPAVLLSAIRPQTQHSRAIAQHLRQSTEPVDHDQNTARTAFARAPWSRATYLQHHSCAFCCKMAQRSISSNTLTLVYVGQASRHLVRHCAAPREQVSPTAYYSQLNALSSTIVRNRNSPNPNDLSDKCEEAT